MFDLVGAQHAAPLHKFTTTDLNGDVYPRFRKTIARAGKTDRGAQTRRWLKHPPARGAADDAAGRDLPQSHADAARAGRPPSAAPLPPRSEERRVHRFRRTPR